MMRPDYDDGFVSMYVGDAAAVLASLPERSVHMCVTSPPYFGLRSYLAADDERKHLEGGTQETPEAYVAWLVDVMRGVWRVLRDDGTLWLNLGDSYAGYWGDKTALKEGRPSAADRRGFSMNDRPKFDKLKASGIKPKDLLLIPARVAIALQSDGWYLRQELVWDKPSCMPESVRDRCTRSHEMLYMLTKKPRYFYDSEAIKENLSGGAVYSGPPSPTKASRAQVGNLGNGASEASRLRLQSSGRNARSVWRISPKPYAGSHYATFPPELPMRCIKAGTSKRGVCSECGAPWQRVVDHRREPDKKTGKNYMMGAGHFRTTPGGPANQEGRVFMRIAESRTVGWEPTCTHSAETMPATVLDPFMGSGTTALVARKLGRKAIGIDLDPRNLVLMEERLGYQGVLF